VGKLSGTVNVCYEGSFLRVLVTRGSRILRWEELAFSPSEFSGGMIVDPGSIGRKLRDLLDKQKVVAERAIVSLNAPGEAHRFLSVPRLSATLMEKAILHDAQETIHLPMEELYLSWQRIRLGRDNLFIVAEPRRTIDSLMQVMLAAGIKNSVFDSKPLALARAVNRPDVVILDLEADNLHAVLVRKGVPRVMRYVPMEAGSAGIRNQILLEELDTTFRLYESAHEEDVLESTLPVVFTGSAAPGVDTYPWMSGLFHRPVEPFKPPVKSPDDFQASLYAAGIGLALKKTSGSERRKVNVPDLDLLVPQVKRPRVRPVRELVFAPLILAGIVAGILAYQFYDDARARTVAAETQIQALGQQMKARQAETKKLEDAKLAVSQARATLEVIDAERRSLLPEMPVAFPPLKTAWNEMEDEVIILNSNFSSGKLMIMGAAPDHQRVLDYARRLDNSRAFKAVDVLESRIQAVGEADAVTYTFIVNDEVIERGPGQEISLFTIQALPAVK
jgi:Tfp pilus assembly protein PilN